MHVALFQVFQRRKKGVTLAIRTTSWVLIGEEYTKNCYSSVRDFITNGLEFSQKSKSASPKKIFKECQEKLDCRVSTKIIYCD